MKKSKSELANSTDVKARIGDLIVHLHRSNGAEAESIVDNIAGCLNEILDSGNDPGSANMRQAQQTLFAIDEVRSCLAERDFGNATSAARDAAKEWKLGPPPAV